MQVLTVLDDLRTELNLAEEVTRQTWEYYAQHVSELSFAAAVDATQCVIALHRQLANRLEQLVGEATLAEIPTALLEHQTPSAA